MGQGESTCTAPTGERTQQRVPHDGAGEHDGEDDVPPHDGRRRQLPRPRVALESEPQQRDAQQQLGLALFSLTLFCSHVILQSKHIQLMTASMVRVTNLTPGSECNPTSHSTAFSNT
jgi:hypothetical protein